MSHGALDAIVVPSGGGGLLVGAAAVCKPQGVIVYGAEPESGGPGLQSARQRGRRTTHFESPSTIADGLRSLTGESNWEIVKERENVEDVFTVTEQHIKEALRLAIEELGFIIEPSAAVPLAVALFNTEFQRRIAMKRRHVRVGIVLTGGNISEKELRAILPDLNLSMGYERHM
jgi:threonine dehydratase